MWNVSLYGKFVLIIVYSGALIALGTWIGYNCKEQQKRIEGYEKFVGEEDMLGKH